MPAGLPLGIPGKGEVMEGAMQQAAQAGRQFMLQVVRISPAVMIFLRLFSQTLI
jgi:hypothetical protein